jgi:hypothetical protein
MEVYGVETSRIPHFLDTGSLMAERLSTSRAGHALPYKMIPVLIYVQGWVNPRDIVKLKGLGKLKNKKKSNDFIRV